MTTDIQFLGSDYFDMDDILAMHTNVTCTLHGTIDPDFFSLVGLSKPDIIDPKGVKVEVPLWMIRSIRDYCEINIPKAYNAAVRDVLTSKNAKSVNLERLQQYFYYVGMHLADLIEREDGKSLTHCLLETLVQRIGEIMSKALQGHSKPKHIDNFERNFFDEIGHWRRDLLQWTNGGKPISKKRKHV